MKKWLIITLSSSLFLSGCNSWFGTDDEKNPYEGTSEKVLYKDALALLKTGEYSDATKRFEAMESMYPFSLHAESAKLKLVYAYYKADDYVSASANAEEFLRLYPRSSRADYAYYLKALSNFKQTRGALANVLPMDESWRDPGSQLDAYNDFEMLVKLYPDSKYKNSAIQHMRYLRDMFAKREFNNANFYFERKMYVAAKGRASYLIKTYPQSNYTKSALKMLYMINLKIGLVKEAEENKRVYETSYHEKL